MMPWPARIRRMILGRIKKEKGQRQALGLVSIKEKDANLIERNHLEALLSLV